jgi:prepilin peptidase CpaA
MGQFLGGLNLTLGSEAALAAYVLPLMMAAITDFHSLRIPNWLTGSMAAAFPVVALLAGHDVDWLSHLEAGAGVFVVAAVLFMFRVMGGGDVKLLAATALWTGVGQLLPFLTLVAIAGGVFAIVVVALRHPLVHATLLAVLRRLPSFTEEKMPIPYGVPIAVAGILMAPSLTFLT